MNKPKQSFCKPACGRLVWLTLAVIALGAAGCRTFDYTDKDLETERKQLKQGSERGIYNNPNGF